LRKGRYALKGVPFLKSWGQAEARPYLRVAAPAAKAEMLPASLRSCEGQDSGDGKYIMLANI
jgi:hypothetical protein